VIQMLPIIEQETQNKKVGWQHYTLLVTMIPEHSLLTLAP